MSPCRTRSALAAQTVPWSYAGFDRYPRVSDQATWSTEATPLARIAGAVVFTLGAFSVVSAALLLAGGRYLAYPAALACLFLTAVFAVLYVRRIHRRLPVFLSWCARSESFFVAGMSVPLELLRVWHGPGWVTLGLRHPATPHKVIRLVVWKSAVPAPLWSELALCLEVGARRRNGYENKENP